MDGKPLIELFVKAATTNKQEKGACLIGQQWFMTLYSLVEQDLINLRFTPMSLDSPPFNYEQLNAARHLPIAWIESGFLNGKDSSGRIISSCTSLEVLMEKLGSPNLNAAISPPKVREAEQVFEDLYRDLMQYIRFDAPKPLLNTLNKLDIFLSHHARPYLLDRYLTYPDCQLMPKLQHMRVAGRAYKQFDIPHNLKYLWAYVKRMYETKAFICSCPSDRDILIHYSEKYQLPTNFRLSLLGAEIMIDIPPNV